MMDKTLDEIRSLEKVIAAGAEREAQLQRYIKREDDPVHRAEVQRHLNTLSAQLDRLEDEARELRKVRNERLDRERRILMGLEPGRKPVNFLGINEFKVAA